MASDKRTRTRDDYPFILDYRTRWNDNDMYDHVNNSVYNFLFDSVVNAYLIQHCHLHPPSSPHRLLVVSSSTEYFSPLAYPSVAEVGLRVVRLGRASVTYELGLFERDVPGVKAVCEFVHVVVERATGRPGREGLPGGLRGGLERLRAVDGKGESKL
ncbi:hypothetical protein E4U54_000375 [Claviceps lovelessii]|nr:hypothetical protein E4U54_000375 [Claviceps lovelessii]